MRPPWKLMDFRRTAGKICTSEHAASFVVTHLRFVGLIVRDNLVRQRGYQGRLYWDTLDWLGRLVHDERACYPEESFPKKNLIHWCSATVLLREHSSFSTKMKNRVWAWHNLCDSLIWPVYCQSALHKNQQATPLM